MAAGAKMKGEEKKGTKKEKGKGGRKKGKRERGREKGAKKGKNKGWGKCKKEKRDELVYSVLHAAIFFLICSKLL